jgi:gluconolactonase
MSEVRQVADGLQFPEGPVAMQDGTVLVVEIRAGTLTRVAPDGSKATVAELGGGPNGAAIGPDGKAYVCNNGGFEWFDYEGMSVPGPEPADYIGGRIQRVDLATGAVEDLYTDCGGHPLKGPNDIVFDTEGGFYFTDLGKSRARDLDKGGLYYAKADGSEIRELVYGLDHPNGVGLAPDESRVYVAETTTGRVWWWDIDAPGALRPGTAMPFAPGQATLLYAFPGYQLLDSLAVDGEGNVCVATLLIGAITVVTPKGEVKDVIDVPHPDPFVTNICFGGDDLRTAYITSSGFGRLYETTWHCPGARLAYSA